MRRRAVLLSVLCLLMSACQQFSGDPYALRTLHKSTLSRVFDRGSIVAAVFGAGRYALVADQHGAESKRLYLVDLEQAKERVVELPAGTPLMLNELVNAGDVALAIFWDSRTMADKVVYRVAMDGRLQPLQYVETVATFGSDAAAGQVLALLAAGRLDNLTRLEKEICKWDEVGRVYRAAGPVARHYFYNEGYLVYSNVPDVVQALEEQSTATAVDSCLLHADPQAPAFKAVLQRAHTPDASQSDLEARILSVDVYRDGEFFWRYEFDLAAEYYYWAGIVGERLYFVGNYVRYLDLAPLLTPAPGP